MSDVNLLMFGCAVSMIAAAGIYVYLRERFTDDQRKLDLVKAEPEQAKETAERPLRKAV